jgi:hypothetical protein
MPQLIVAQSAEGIILAAENRAIQIDAKGEEVSLQVNRLIPLSPQAALLVAGAAEGVDMGQTLKNFIQGEGIQDIQDLYPAAMAFLSTEYERFMRKKCEILPIDPLHHVSFILAGKTDRDAGHPFRLYFLWNKKRLPQLDGDEISHAFSLPRRMGLEYQLNQMAKEKVPLQTMAETIKEGIQKLRSQGEIQAPVSWAWITPKGYQPFAA